MNIFFSLIVVGSLFPAIYVNPRVFIITGIAYFLLLIETACSQTNSFLKNIMKVSDLVEVTHRNGKEYRRETRVKTYFACQVTELRY